LLKGARMMNRCFSGFLLLSLSLSLAACATSDDGVDGNEDGVIQNTETPAFAGSCSARRGGALVTISVGGEESPEKFTAWVTNIDFIAEAKRLLADNDRGTPNFKMLLGSDCDAQWDFHVDPVDAEFPWGTIELCDGLPSYVNQHKEEWERTVVRWCPWGSRVLSVVEQ
jgi:hypothetical protein